MSFRVDEDGVGPGFGVRSRAAQRLLLTEAGDERLGAGDHQEPRVAAGGGRRLDLPGVLFRGDQVSAHPGVEAAPLRELVVLDSVAVRAGALELAGVAYAAIGVAVAFEGDGDHR